MDIECQCQSTFICVVCDEQLVSGPAMVIFQPSTRDTQFQSAGSCVEGLGVCGETLQRQKCNFFSNLFYPHDKSFVSRQPDLSTRGKCISVRQYETAKD
jgi:hypothetical protein